MKLIKVADLKDVLNAYYKEEISYSKMAEILNNTANERLKAINYSQCCKSDSELLKIPKTTKEQRVQLNEGYNKK